MSGQWEVVINKKNVQKKKNKLSKAEKKRFAENAPKIEDIVPVAQMKTLYDNLDDARPEGNIEPSSTNSDVKKTKKHKRKTDTGEKTQSNKPQSKKCTSARTITARDVLNLIDFNEKKFKGVASIFLKDLATLLNSTLPNDSKSMNFSAKSFDHPLCTLPVDVQKILKGHVKKMMPVTFMVVFTECLEAVAKDMVKEYRVIGYKIVLQLIAMHFPQVVLSGLNNFSTLCSSYQNRPLICTTLLWALGQSGFKDLSTGLRVWSDIMLPLSQQKKYSSFAVEYLEHLIARHSTSKGLTVEQYFSTFDKLVEIWPKLDSTRAADLLRNFWRIKYILCNVHPADKLHTLMEPLFDKITASEGLTLRFEPIHFIAYCLCQDKECYNVWKGYYAHKIIESSLVLDFINDNWIEFDFKTYQKELQELLKVFKSTNEQFGSGGKNKYNEVDECNKLVS